jgi:hypothetical protein
MLQMMPVSCCAVQRMVSPGSPEVAAGVCSVHGRRHRCSASLLRTNADYPAGDLPMPDAPDQEEPLPTPASGPLPASPAGGASPAGSAPRLPSIEPFADGEPLSTGRCGFHSHPTRLVTLSLQNICCMLVLCTTSYCHAPVRLQMECSNSSRSAGPFYRSVWSVHAGHMQAPGSSRRAGGSGRRGRRGSHSRCAAQAPGCCCPVHLSAGAAGAGSGAHVGFQGLIFHAATCLCAAPRRTTPPSCRPRRSRG